MNNHNLYIYRTVGQRIPIIDIDEEGNLIQDNYEEIVDIFDTVIACEACEQTKQNIFAVHNISKDWKVF